LYGGVDLSFKNTYVSQPVSEPTLGQEALKAKPSDSFSWRFPFRQTEQRATMISLEPIKQMGNNKIVAPKLQPSPNASFAIDLKYDSFSKPTDARTGTWNFDLSKLEFPSPKKLYDVGELYDQIDLIDATTGERQHYTGPKELRGQTVYQLQASQVYLELGKDGRFTQRGSQGVVREFDPDGRVLSETKSDGTRIVYSYQGNLLTSVEGQAGQWMKLVYDANGSLQEMSNSTNQSRHYRYNTAKQLVQVENEQGQVLARYGYDAEGHLSESRDAQDRVLSQYVYDEIGRVLADWDANGYRLYNWDTQQPVVQYIATSRWTELADPTFRTSFLNDVKMLRRLDSSNWQGNLKSNTIYMRTRGGRTLVMVNGDAIDLPSNVAENAKALRAELEKRQLVSKDGAILIFDGDSQQVTFEDAFQGRYVLYAEKPNVEMIVRNANELSKSSPVSPDSTGIIIALPRGNQTQLQEQLANAGLNASRSSEWQGIYDQYQQVIQKNEFAKSLSPNVGLDEQIIRSLQQRDKTMILVAHSDGKAVYLPDRPGSTFEPNKLDQATKDAIRNNRPVIILLSCEAANTSAGNSLAYQLVELGATAVIASPGQVGARAPSQLIDRFLYYSRQPGTRTLLDAWFNALKDVMPNIDLQDRNFRLFISQDKQITIPIS
jgi:YD repeat-containing protein